MSNSLRASLLACTALAAFSIPVIAFAQDAEDGAVELGTIVVKGKRVPAGSVEDTPLATQTTAKEIAQKDITSLDDLGNTTEPGVSWVAETQSVNIRGLEEDRVLTTIDGIPIPYLSDGVRASYGGANTYDFSSLSSVDILRGGDSSRAGSGALGGAVLLRTLEPEDLIGGGQNFGGVAKATFDGKDQSIGGSAAIAKKIENTSILFQGSYKKGHESKTGGDIGGYGANRTKADPEEYDQRNILFKIRQDLEGGHQIGLTAEHFNFDSTTNLKSEQGSSYAQDDYDNLVDNTRNRVSLDYSYEAIAEDSLISSAFATLYWQHTERQEGTDGERLTDPKGGYGRISTNEEQAFGFAGFVNSDFVTGDLSHRLTMGGDFSFATTTQIQVGHDTCDVTYVSNCAFYHNNQADMPETDAAKLGLYMEDRIEVGQTGLTVTPGIRFDWYDYNPKETAGYENNSGYAGLPDGQSDWQLSPKLRAAYQVRPDVELFAQFAMGFKAPNVTQLYVNYDNAPFYRSFGNSDLEAETSYGFELGANLGDEDFGGRITAFTTRYKNFIDTDTVTTAGYAFGSIEYFNRDKVRISGVEVRAHKTFTSGFNLHGSVAYAYGEDIDTGELLASVAPLKGIFGVGFEQETWGADASLIASAAVDNDSTASSKPDGYGIVNLTGWWEPEQFQGLRLQAGVYNVFDKTYFDALEVKEASTLSDLYSESGRYFKVSLTQRF